jgi:twinkle protein
MTKLRSLAEETGVGIIAIVHLKRAKDKTFNEGSQISLNDLRGSASLEQLSDNVIALERDQQAKKARGPVGDPRAEVP